MPKDNRGGKRGTPNAKGISYLLKSNASFQKQIKDHQSYINNPKIKYSNWDSFTDARKAQEIRHWNKEIQNFKSNIARNNAQIKKIKESGNG